MDKKNSIYRTASFIIALCMSISAAFAQKAWISNDNAAHNIVWPGKLHRYIEFLSDSLCSGRATGTPGNTEAAFWTIRSFRKAGLLPFNGSYAKHIYAGGGIVGHNIMGMIPGCIKGPHRDSYIIIGAHYDHLGVLAGRMYPGADSNASGTAALVSLAEMFSATKTIGSVYGKNIIFVAFDANCMNLAGSYALWHAIESGDLIDPVSGEAITPDKVDLMVNIDQIGSSLAPLSSGDRNYIIMLGNDSLDREDRGIITLCNMFYGPDLEISHTYYGSKDFTRIFYTLSDQKVFVENKVPSVLFTSGITLNNNKTYDTVETLDMDVLYKRIILMFRWIEKML